MKTSKSLLAVLVISSMFAGSVNAIPASDIFLSNGGDVETAINQISGQVGGLGSDILSINNDISQQNTAIAHASNVASAAQISANEANQKASVNSSDITILENIAVHQDADITSARQTANHADLAAADARYRANNAQDTANANAMRITALENAPKPVNGLDGKDGAKGEKGDTGAAGIAGKDGIDGKNGIDGKEGKEGPQGIQGVKGDTGAAGKDGINGKDGVNGKDGKNGSNGITTVVHKKEVDSTTLSRVNANSQSIKAVSDTTRVQAQDLQAAKQFISQAQAANNNRFQSLKEEVDGNKQEARGGVASAIAIASMPQVQAGQRFIISAGTGAFKNEQAVSVGASFHASENTIIKAGISDSTNNDFAMGAGVGIGF